MPSALPRERYKKGEQSRCAILEAAKELIARKGFSAISLDDVLKAAAVTKGKFFHHFSSKDDLFVQLLSHFINDREILHYDQLLEGRESESPFANLIFLVDRMIEWHSRGLPEVMRLCVFATVFFPSDSAEIVRFKRILARNSRVLRGLVRESQKRGELPDFLDPSVMALLFPSAAVGGNTVGFLAGKKGLTARNLRELKAMLHSLNRTGAQRRGRAVC